MACGERQRSSLTWCQGVNMAGPDQHANPSSTVPTAAAVALGVTYLLCMEAAVLASQSLTYHFGVLVDEHRRSCCLQKVHVST
jgi:hypothetical protein